MMSRAFLFFLCLSFFCTIKVSGQLPIEKQLLKGLTTSSNTEQRCQALNDLVRFYLYYNPSKVKMHLDFALQMASSENFPKQKLKAQINAGFYNLRIDNYQKAIDILNEAQQSALALKDYKSIAEIEQILARVYNGKGEYDTSMKLLISAQKHLQQSGDKTLQGRILESMGDINDKFGNTSLALDNLKESIKQKELFQDTVELSRSYAFLGNVYFRELDYSKALEQYDNGITLAKKYFNYNSLAYIYSRKAKLLLAQKKFNQANDLIDQSFELAQEQQNFWLMNRLLVSKSQILQIKGNLQEALEIAEKGLEIATEKSDDEGQSFCLKQLTSLYGELKDYKNGFLMLQKLEMLENKIWNNNISSIITTKELELKSELELRNLEQEQERKDLLRKKEKETNRKVMIIIVIVLFMVLVFGIFITYRYRIAKRQKKIIEQQAKENLFLMKSFTAQDRNSTLNEIASGIAHELNSPLSAVQSSAQAIQSLLFSPYFQSFLELSETDKTALLSIFENITGTKNYIGKQRRQRAAFIQSKLEKYEWKDADLKQLANVISEIPFDIDEPTLEVVSKSNHPMNFIFSMIFLGKILFFAQTSKDSALRISEKINELEKFLNSVDTEVVEPIKLKDSIQTVVNLVQHEVQGVTFKKLDIDKAITVRSSRSKLYQIWYNIIKNALESQSGSLVEKLELEISCQKIDNQLDIVFSNNGNEIPADIKGLIFNYFFTTKQDAPGLGLAIVKNHVEAMNGTIDVRSEPSKTSFIISIPC